MEVPPLVWDPRYEIDLGVHVFATEKYRKTRERILAEKTVTEDHIVSSTPITYEDLAHVHTDEYLDKIATNSFSAFEIIELEIPYSEKAREGLMLMCGGTLLAGRLALEHGCAAHLGGGFHHAFAGHGEGFCLLNDVAVASRVLIAESQIERVAIVDLDVHHGNGTAAIFADDQSVFTFSMHQESNYPAEKPPSDLDLGLDDHASDEVYLDLLSEHLPKVLKDHDPDLVFYLAGADPYKDDQLGGLGLTLKGLRCRDRFVYDSVRDRQIALAVVLAGGYAFRPEDTVAIHVATIEELVSRSVG